MDSQRSLDALLQRFSLAKKRVLVLDGETRTSLAVVRSLGEKGVNVAAAACHRFALSFASKYTQHKLLCPNALNEPQAYQAWLLQAAGEFCPDVVLPLTDLSCSLCLAIEDELRELTSMPLVSADVFSELSNKAELAKTAKACGIACPAALSLPLATRSRIEEVAAVRAFRYPAVLKPAVSVVRARSGAIRLPVMYVDNPEIVIETIQGQKDKRCLQVPFLLQERIAGPGCGVFALCHRGRVLTVFCHRRLLEKPPSGGVSVLSESIALADAPVSQAVMLLEQYHFHGAAMVEFKQGPSGEFYLMEVNARLWGSLQLAVAAGRDFPLLLVLLALAKDHAAESALAEYCAALPPYQDGLRLRWLLGTLDHALIRAKKEPFTFLLHLFLRNSLRLSAKKRTVFDVFRKDDPRPFLYELRNWLLI